MVAVLQLKMIKTKIEMIMIILILQENNKKKKNLKRVRCKIVGLWILRKGAMNIVDKLTPNSETVVNTEEHFECYSSCF